MITLEEGLASFEDWMSHEKYFSAHTQKAYKADVLEALAFFNNGEVPFGQALASLPFTKSLVRSWLAARLKQGKSHRSNARALSSIKTLLGFVTYHFVQDD